MTFVEMQSPDLALAVLKEARPGADPSMEAYYGCRDDLTDILHDHILVRAYYLAEGSPRQDTASNWFEAERDVLRGAFVNARFFHAAAWIHIVKPGQSLRSRNRCSTELEQEHRSSGVVNNRLHAS